MASRRHGEAEAARCLAFAIETQGLYLVIFCELDDQMDETCVFNLSFQLRRQQSMGNFRRGGQSVNIASQQAGGGGGQ